MRARTRSRRYVRGWRCGPHRRERCPGDRLRPAADARARARHAPGAHVAAGAAQVASLRRGAGRIDARRDTTGERGRTRRRAAARLLRAHERGGAVVGHEALTHTARGALWVDAAVAVLNRGAALLGVERA